MPRAAFILSSALLLAAFAAFAMQGLPSRAAEKHPVKGAAKADTGRLCSFHLASAPFPDPERSHGYSYDGEDLPRAGHYDDSTVDVFIPAGFKPRGTVNLVFFFHGWYSSVPEEIENFSLLRQFSESGARALLVLPETARDAPDSYGGKLESAGGFDRLVTELLRKLHASGATPPLRAGGISLLGHSGAYRVMASILGQGGVAKKVREVCLFDGLYDDVERYAAWIAGGNRRFVSISSEDGDPADNAHRLIAELKEDGIPVETGADTPADYRRLRDHRAAFIFSSCSHDMIVNSDDELRRVLAMQKWLR
jgi:methylmalonyl-CoA mutase cobalamin-binding subunit